MVGTLRYGTRVNIFEQFGSWYRVVIDRWVPEIYTKIV